MNKIFTLAVLTALSLFCFVGCEISNTDNSNINKQVINQDDSQKPDNNSYLLVDVEDKRFHEVRGNGFKAGVIANIEIYGKLKEDTAPVVVIPEPDNYADCKISAIKLINTEKPFNSVSEYTWKTYEITIDTAVVTDTGGCLVWIKGTNSETVSIIDYIYITEF